MLPFNERVPEGAYPSTEALKLAANQPPQPQREAREVYRSTWQDLPCSTAASVIQQLDQSENPLTALRPFYAVEDENDATLVFESRFESGNLHTASQVGDFEYELALKNDTNTWGHTQWYFFSMSNTRKGASYKLILTNLLKNESLYNQGLRPLMLSTKAASEAGVGWRRAGSSVWYYANSSLSKRTGEALYSLSFVIETEHDNDTIYLAHCYPYTYRDLLVHLRGIEQTPELQALVRLRELCTTEAGNVCHVLTITEPWAEEEDKRVVVITARYDHRP